MGMEAVLEVVWIDDHAGNYWWRKSPQPKMLINTTLYYYGSSGGESAASVGVPAYPAAVPYSSEANKDAPDISPEYVSGPDIAFNCMHLPHCLNHQPARSGCDNRIIATRRNTRQLNGVPTTVAKHARCYAYNVSRAHHRLLRP